MIDRKSTITSLNWILETPAFRAVAWVERANNQRLAFVTLGPDQEDFSRFRNHDVIIDGARYLCLDVITFTPGPCRKGDSVGILIARA